MERWAVLGHGESHPWSSRAAIAVEMMQGPESVTDLGCGAMLLEQHLPETSTYRPVDCVPRDARTLVIDFNVTPVPHLDTQWVACLGLLEYLFDVRKFLEDLRKGYNRAVITYCPADAPLPLEPRRAHAWVNDHRLDEIERLFLEAGWTVAERRSIDNAQYAWKLVNN